MTHDFTSHERSEEIKTRYQRQHEPFAPENACAHRQPDEQETSALCEHSQGCYTQTPCCTSLTRRPASAPSSSAFNTLMQYMPVETNHQLSNKPVSHPICPRAAPDSGLVRLLISRNRKVVVCFSETRNCRCRVATRLVSPLMSLPVYASHSLALFLSVHTQRKCKGQQSALGHLRREIHQVCRQPHHRDAAPCPWTLRAAVLFM